jgi:hypothetical protein
MDDLHHLLAIYVHAHQTGDSVPPHIDAEARTALAAAPPAPDPREALAARPLLEAVARMADRIGQHTVGEITVISDRAAAWLAENQPGQPVAIEPRGCPAPGACSCVEPPAPDHLRTATEMVADGDGEREELAALIHQIALAWEPDVCLLGNMTASQLARAAALLRQPAPTPVPVADRPWEREGWCADWGWCWVFVQGQWVRDYPQNYPDGVFLPHWAIPQPPQGGEVAG